MDWIRVPYRTKMRFVPDGPLVDVTWYIVPDDTPVFPGHHSFASRAWDPGAGGPGTNPVGEPEHPVFKPDQSGRPFVAASSAKPCGPLEWFTDGAPADAPDLVLAADGYPACCGRVGGVSTMLDIGVFEGNVVHGATLALFSPDAGFNVWETDPGTALITPIPAGVGQAGFLTAGPQSIDGIKSFLATLVAGGGIKLPGGQSIQWPTTPDVPNNNTQINVVINPGGDLVVVSVRGTTVNNLSEWRIDNASGAFTFGRLEGGVTKRARLFVTKADGSTAEGATGTLPDGSAVNSGLLTAIGAGSPAVTAVTASSPLTSSGGATPDIAFANVAQDLVLAGPSSGSGAPAFRALTPAMVPVPTSVGAWTKYTKTFANYSVAATTGDSTLVTLPAKTVIDGVVIKHNAQWTGPGLASLAGSVGVILGAFTLYSSLSGMHNAPANTSLATNLTSWPTASAVPNFGGTQAVILRVQANINLNLLTGGSVEVWLRTATLP